MAQQFKLPEGLIGRFAVVKLWPEIKAAEDECIARLKIAATALGLECIEIQADGRLLEEPSRVISKKEVDFVLHLHYDTPKLYDVFSFVALWNPVQFYHEWGYQRCSRNLISHDDFLSCSSPAADNHLGRLIRRTTHSSPRFNLYHSLADIVNLPSLGDHKLFYAGINWEALGRGKSRHQELLKRLDETGMLRIYGPTLFQGVRVWKGYKSYVKEIPFDGISMTKEIAKAGIALVLSSPAHKESELMSSRLFESIASGALVISDENNFSKKFFENTLLYIDTRCSVDKICHDIFKHLAWVEENPDEALKMIKKAQDIFREKFTFKKNLTDLYYGFSDRKRDLLKRQGLEDRTQISVRLCLLMPEYSEAVLNRHIDNVLAQEYEKFSPVLIVDRAEVAEYRSCIEGILKKVSVSIEVQEFDFFTYGPNREVKARRKLGAALTEVILANSRTDTLVFVAPNEKLFSNHLQVLVGSLTRNPDRNCAATAAILKHGHNLFHSVHERIDFRHLNPFVPNGYARYIFRTSALPQDLKLALPYLDRKALAALIGEEMIVQDVSSTVVIDIENEFPSGPWNEGQENAVISNFSPAAFRTYTGYETILPPLPPALAAGVSERTTQLLHFIGAQVQAVRIHGLAPRLAALKRKIKKKLAE